MSINQATQSADGPTLNLTASASCQISRSCGLISQHKYWTQIYAKSILYEQQEIGQLVKELNMKMKTVEEMNFDKEYVFMKESIASLNS